MKVSPGTLLGERAWDQALLAQVGSGLLQSWRWGELQSRFGWRLDRLAFDDGQTGVCSMQESTREWILGPIAYVPRGPAVAPRARADVLDELERRAGAASAAVLRVEPPVPPEDPWASLLTARGFHPGSAVQPQATRVLDLTRSSDRLRADLRPKTRYNLSLAERKGVAVSASREVKVFAGLALDTAHRQGIHLPGVDYYQAALELFDPEDAVRLYLARYDGDALAGIMVFRFGETAYYLFGGSSYEQRELMPNYLLHWRAILDFKALGCRTYDWWGIPDEPAPSHPWFGLYRFKVGFGGETVRYTGLYERVLRHARWRWAGRLRKLKQRVRKPILP